MCRRQQLSCINIHWYFRFKFFFFLTGRFPFSGQNTPIFGANRPASEPNRHESGNEKKTGRGSTRRQRRPSHVAASDAGAAAILPRLCIPEFETPQFKPKMAIGNLVSSLITFPALVHPWIQKCQSLDSTCCDTTFELVLGKRQ